MAAVRLRLRLPGGQSTFTGTTFAELSAHVSLSSFELLTGFPPTKIEWEESMALSEVLSSGDTVVVRETVGAAPEPKVARLAPTAPAAVDEDEDEALKLALAMSMAQPEASVAPPPASAPPVCVPVSAPPAGAALGEGEAVVRRVIPADNSCLFNAVAYALEGRSKTDAPRLRDVVASAVLTEGGEYASEAVLGQEPGAYAKWIRDPAHWGGGVELGEGCSPIEPSSSKLGCRPWATDPAQLQRLSLPPPLAPSAGRHAPCPRPVLAAVLSKHYSTEIAAFDIQTLRVDNFGQGSGYAQRIFLLYDGIHYDLMVKTLFAGAPQELDVTVFCVDDEAAMAQARGVAAEAHRARQFTDTAKFSLRCLGCQKGLVGEKDAMEHAKATGHTNFSEYK